MNRCQWWQRISKEYFSILRHNKKRCLKHFPFGLITPFKVAEVEVMLVAFPVVAVGLAKVEEERLEDAPNKILHSDFRHFHLAGVNIISSATIIKPAAGIQKNVPLFGWLLE